MRLRSYLVTNALMSLALATGLVRPLPPILIDRAECESDHPGAAPPTRPVLPLPPPEFRSKDLTLSAAYYNALSILSTNNQCSDFFGGPSAMTVLNLLVVQARKDYFSNTIAMRMHGETINGHDARTNTRYRLFTKVSINGNGPFYKRGNGRSERWITGVGSFDANTEEVRVLILLHELGHLIRRSDGQWLLPDDGGNDQLSRKNSRQIEEVCRDEFKRLGDVEPLRNLARQNRVDEKVTLDRNDPEQARLGNAGDH